LNNGAVKDGDRLAPAPLVSGLMQRELNTICADALDFHDVCEGGVSTESNNEKRTKKTLTIKDARTD